VRAAQQLGRAESGADEQHHRRPGFGAPRVGLHALPARKTSPPTGAAHAHPKMGTRCGSVDGKDKTAPLSFKDS
jgi:hypothetical protein